VDLFDDGFLETRYPPDHPRLPNLRNGYATPADLLQSGLQAVGGWRPGDAALSSKRAGTDGLPALGSSAPEPIIPLDSRRCKHYKYSAIDAAPLEPKR
jgi:hypothetical protein